MRLLENLGQRRPDGVGQVHGLAAGPQALGRICAPVHRGQPLDHEPGALGQPGPYDAAAMGLQPIPKLLGGTKVDALAVAVGTSHAMLTQDATLDFKLIGGLGARVEIPLVLHGSSGVSDP
jgi:hypothetical protein